MIDHQSKTTPGAGRICRLGTIVRPIDRWVKGVAIAPNRLLMAGVSGLLLTAAFPKIGIAWLAWIAWVPLLLALHDLPGGSAFLLGWLSGLVHNLGLVYWMAYTMQVYGNLPIYQSVPVLFLVASYLALYPALFCCGAVILCRRPIELLTLPLLWVALEYGRAHLFSGFPWQMLGHSQYQALSMVQIADLFGVYGISLLVMGTNVVFAVALFRFSKKRWQGASIPTGMVKSAALGLALILAATWGYGQMRLNQIDGLSKKAVSRKIAVIQGNIDQSKKWDPTYQLLTIKKYLLMSQSAAKQSPALIVWPETATPFYFLFDPLLTRMVQNGIRRIGTSVVFGSPYYEQKGAGRWLFNSAYLLDKDAHVVGRYDKVHLVPFGEYVPMKRWMPFIDTMVAQVGDFKPGRRGDTLPWQGGRLGIQICYEIIFPELSAAMVRNGANLLINITNDAWFGRTSAAFQHFSMAVFRAIENRRVLVRAANTGISGFVDPAGRILAKTPLYKDRKIQQSVPIMDVITFYTCHGDLFARSCAVICLLLGLFRLYRHGAERFRWRNADGA
jgi:apolipoprotein N-acyltransferase